MKKLILISLILLSSLVKAQQIDTITTIIVKNNDSVVYCYHYNYVTQKGDTAEYIDADLLQPELNNYINLVIKDYCSNDTLNWIQYQQENGNESFLIDTKKRRFRVELSELSRPLQESIYLFGIKLKAIIRNEN